MYKSTVYELLPVRVYCISRVQPRNSLFRSKPQATEQLSEEELEETEKALSFTDVKRHSPKLEPKTDQEVKREVPKAIQRYLSALSLQKDPTGSFGSERLLASL